MVKQALKVDGLTCDSCEKVIRKVFATEQGLASMEFDFSKQIVTIDYNPELLSLDQAAALIRDKGYKVSLPEKMGGEGAIKKGKQQQPRKNIAYLVEKRMVKLAIAAFFVLAILESVAYLGFFKRVENFLPAYGAYLFYLLIGVIANAAAIMHLRCYRKEVDCMSGMMIGMTLGMISGFMGGAIVGATNGMFVGSVYGMVVGMAIGAWCGTCCGVMGTMEGLMAGLMGGTMGAMLSVMMIFDHINLFIPLLFFSCVIILGGLTYMMLEKHGPAAAEHDIYDMTLFVMICYLVVFITTLIMVYGPKSGVGV